MSGTPAPAATNTRALPRTTTKAASRAQGGVKKSVAKPRTILKTFQAGAARISASIEDAVTTRQRPTAADFFTKKGDKDTSTHTSTTSNTPATSGPSVTPVPDSTPKAQAGPLAKKDDQSLVSAAAKLTGSTANRFKPASTPALRALARSAPAERFEPVSLPPTTTSPAAFGQYRDRTEKDGDDDSEDDDDSKPKPSKEDDDDEDEKVGEPESEDSSSEEEDDDSLPDYEDTVKAEEKPAEKKKEESKPAEKKEEVAVKAPAWTKAVFVKPTIPRSQLPTPAKRPAQPSIVLPAVAQPAIARPAVAQPAVQQPVVPVQPIRRRVSAPLHLVIVQPTVVQPAAVQPAVVVQPPVQEAEPEPIQIDEDDAVVIARARQSVQPAVVQPAVVQPPAQQAEAIEIDQDDDFGQPAAVQPAVVQPAVQEAQDTEVELKDYQPEVEDVPDVEFTDYQPKDEGKAKIVPVVCAGDVEMTSAGNPFGAPSGAPSSAAPVFGGPVPTSPFAQQQPAAQQQQPAMSTAFGASPFSASPFSNAAAPAPAVPTTTTPAFGATPFGATPFGHLSKAVSTTTSAFGAPSGLSLPNISNQPRQPSPGPIVNPFAPSSKPQQTASTNIAAPASSPLGIFTNSVSDSAQIGVTKPNPFDALKKASAQQIQQSGAPKPNPFDAFKKNQPQPSAAVSAPSFGGPKKTVHFADDVQTSTTPAVKMVDGRFAPQPSEGTKKLSSLAVDYAQKVHLQLRSDGITAPKWPLDPGNPAQRPAMEKLKEAYKKYRARAYDSLRKAEIIDHPDHKRRLEDALTFKGICEDMCPDYEQVTRICEYDVKKEEKRPAPNGGDPWPEPSKMVKKFARSAAGIEEPLPMDVRSMDALKRSTDYLLGELLKTDDQLPSLHGYLWDRTRAVRKDFSFHSQKSSEEMQVMVYILETIARFHVVSLHLLSRKGVASDDFDQQQEVQQLGATLLSLNETYDDCRPRNLVCENEGEFRALYLLLNMHDTSVVEKSLEWASQPWYNSTHMENAKSLIAALQSSDQVTGPFAPRSLGTHIAAPGFTKFFDLVGSKTVSYTMACMCEIHFTWLRQRILQTLVKGFARRRDWPKDITPRILNRMLRFDTDEEAVEFVKLHGFEFETRRVDGRQQQFLLLKSKRQHVPSPRVSQSHSATIVEAKRNGQPLAEVFRNSIYGDKDIEFNDEDSEKSNVLPDNTANNVDSDDGDDMFVGQSSRAKPAQSTQDINGKQPRAQQTTSSFGAPSGAPFAAKTSPFDSSKSLDIDPLLPRKTSPFAPTNATSSVPQPTNGVLQNGITKVSASQPSVPSASPFLHSSGKPFTNPFASLTPATQQPAANNGPSTPVAQPAKAAETSASSFMNAAQKQTQSPASGTSVFADVGKTSSPFQGFATGGSQTSTPTAATPSTVNKGTSILEAKTATPQSSVFSALASDKSTPPSGGFFPTSTPVAPASSGIQPSAASTTPATSIFSAAGSVDANKSTSAAPSTASVFAQPPATTSGTPAPASQSQTSQLGSTPTQNVETHAKQASATPAALPSSPAPRAKLDPMGAFTKWIVAGDDGLISDFTEFAIENILAETYAEFQVEEAERRRKEEDDASWAAAREHMAHRLSVKYFYRWRETAREMRMRTILLEGKAKYKAAMEAKMKAKREKQHAERKAAERKKRDELAAREERLRNSTAADDLEKIIAESRESRQSSTEEALLATGVFTGVRNERQAARRVVKEAYPPARRTSSQSSQSMAPPVIRTPPAKKEGCKTQQIREKFSIGRRDSFSSTSAYNTGTSSFSRSLPVGGVKTGKVTNFSALSSRKRSAETSDDEPAPKKGKSLHIGEHKTGRAKSLHIVERMTAKAPKVTNFSASSSRKRSAEASDDEPAAKKGKILKSGYTLHWELRRRGLVQMPDGQWLPQRIASQMYEGKRFKGYGDCGLGPGKVDTDADAEDQAMAKDIKDKKENLKDIKDKPAASSSLRESKFEALSKRFGFPPTKRYRRDSLASGSSYNATSLLSSSPGSKRKRDGGADADDEGSPAAKKPFVIDESSSDESGGEGAPTTPAAKMERSVAKMRRQVRELTESMDVLEAEDTPWMREQTRRLAAGQKGAGASLGGYGELNGGVRDEGGL